MQRRMHRPSLWTAQDPTLGLRGCLSSVTFSFRKLILVPKLQPPTVCIDGGSFGVYMQFQIRVLDPPPLQSLKYFCKCTTQGSPGSPGAQVASGWALLSLADMPVLLSLLSNLKAPPVHSPFGF